MWLLIVSFVIVAVVVGVGAGLGLQSWDRSKTRADKIENKTNEILNKFSVN